MAWTTNQSSPPPKSVIKRRIMVVADPTRESAGALQYTLSHAMQDNDDLILIHVSNANARRPIFRSLFRRYSDTGTDPTFTLGDAVEGSVGGGDGRDGEFLEIMKRACESAHSNSKVWIEKMEQGNMEKGVAILLKCRLLAIDLLVIGQRRHLSSVILGPRIRTSSGGALRGVTKTIDTAEFLIEHSPCTCVAVQKKGQNAGYLLNSKTHKNFWLLA